MSAVIRNPILPGFNPDPSIARVDDDYYSQPGVLFRLMTPTQQQVLIDNTTRSIRGVPTSIQLRHVAHCCKADSTYGRGLADALGIPPSELAQEARRTG